MKITNSLLFLVVLFFLVSLAACERTENKFALNKDKLNKSAKINLKNDEHKKENKTRLKKKNKELLSVVPKKKTKLAEKKAPTKVIAKKSIQAPVESKQSVDKKIVSKSVKSISDNNAVTVAEIKKQASKTVDLARSYYSSREKDYHENIDKKLIAFEKRLDSLKARGQKIAQEAKKNVSNKITGIETKLSDVASELEKTTDTKEDDLFELSKKLDSILAEIESNIPQKEAQKS